MSEPPEKKPPQRRPSTRSRGAVTIQQVAAHAGVSAMTVSNVINGRKRTQAATREAVLKAVEQLGYVPNAAARSLAAARGQRIGFLYADPENAFLSSLLVGALHAVTRLGVQLTIHPFSYQQKPLEEVRRVAEGPIDGLLLPAPLCEMVDGDALAAALPIPVVGLGAGERLAQIPGIRIDNVAAMEAATNHLLRLGHRRIGYIGGTTRHAASATRYIGFARAMEAAGVSVDSALVVPGDFSFESGAVAAQMLLGRPGRPSAIIASTDDMAAGAISVAHRLGMDVPTELSVVGFNDSPIALRTWPTLTTIRQPMIGMAERATEALVRAIRATDPKQLDGPRDELFPFEVVERCSTRRPR